MDLYLSDIHLGSPLFDSESDLIKLIKDDRFRRIFFVGDIFDVWEQELSKIQNDHHSFIAEVNNQIRSNKKEIIAIKGNHDPDEAMIKYVWPQAKICKDKYIEKDVIVIHGNEFDGAILKVEFFNKLLYYLFIWPIQKFFKYNIRDRFRSMLYSPASRRGKKHYDRLVLQIEKDAIKKYQDQYNYVIMGHTHFPKIVNCEEETCHCDYINCGDWIHNRSYVIRDDDGKFHLEGEIRG
jgi:UDP-2,3-diacylglucosamine pyrophosphatase LpxH